jgi:carboxyl-terminal processing protease
MGENRKVEVLERGDRVRVTTLQVATPKGKKLHFVEPKLVKARRVEKEVGYLKIAKFPGVVGIGVAAEISRAIEGLGNVDRLIIDLRGNTGGGVGALRAMSILTPHKLPVGFALDRKSSPLNIEEEKSRFRRFNRIPDSKIALWLLAIRYLPILSKKSPVVLETEGLGPKSFHGHIVLLVDRHTASAAEMIVAFAKENHLATIVGEKTAGRLLSATSQKVGQGYRLALPTGAYCTWKGIVLEGTPIDPDVVAEFNWHEARRGKDTQLDRALEVVKSSSDYSTFNG